jgi:hypothetical protein
VGAADVKCTLDWCEDGRYGRSPYCRIHHRRWKRYGDPLRLERGAHSVEARFWGAVDLNGPPAVGLGTCSLWTGAVSDTGYGVFEDADKRQWSAHAYAWHLAGRYVPRVGSGLQLDHLCHTVDLAAGLCLGGRRCIHRRCAEIEHLELVPILLNVQRSAAGSKVKCPAGHDYTPENTYEWTNADGETSRHCRRCAADREARRKREGIGRWAGANRKASA